MVKAMSKWLISGGIIGALLMAVFGEIIAQPIVDGSIKSYVKSLVPKSDEELCSDRAVRLSLWRNSDQLSKSRMVRTMDLECKQFDAYKETRVHLFPVAEFPIHKNDEPAFTGYYDEPVKIEPKSLKIRLVELAELERKRLADANTRAVDLAAKRAERARVERSKKIAPLTKP